MSRAYVMQNPGRLVAAAPEPSDEPEPWWDPGVPALPPRFQPVAEGDWMSVVDGGADQRVVNQLRLRCGMKDCPGDLGRLTLAVAERAPEAPAQEVYFEPQRGLFPADGSDLYRWEEGRRAQKHRAQGRPLLSRRPHRVVDDWRSDRPDSPWEIRAFSVCLDLKRGGFEARCPVCRRLLRLLGPDALAALDGGGVPG